MAVELQPVYGGFDMRNIARIRNLPPSTQNGEPVVHEQLSASGGTLTITASAAQALQNGMTAAEGQLYFVSGVDKMYYGDSAGNLINLIDGHTYFTPFIFDFRTDDYTDLTIEGSGSAFTQNAGDMSNDEFEMLRDATLGMRIQKIAGTSTSHFWKLRGDFVSNRREEKNYSFIFNSEFETNEFMFGVLNGNTGITGSDTSSNQMYSAYCQAASAVTGFKRNGGTHNTTDYNYTLNTHWVKVTLLKMGISEEIVVVNRVVDETLTGDALFAAANEDNASPVPRYFRSGYVTSNLYQHPTSCFGSYIRALENTVSGNYRLNLLAVRVF